MKKFLVTISYEVDSFANNKMVFEAFEDLLNREKDEEHEKIEVVSVISTKENRG